MGIAGVRVASRRNSEAWSGKGVAAVFASPASGFDFALHYRASSTTQIDMAAGETWSLGCAVEVDRFWSGSSGYCTTSWICH